MRLSEAVIELLEEIEWVLETNHNRLPEYFVNEYEQRCTYEYGIVGNACRVCVVTTPTGSKFVGHALVLDPNNDVEAIGNKYARANAIDGNLWQFLGGIAKLLDNTKGVSNE